MQTYKNLEILLIDDGSPDRCGSICDEYARNDNRIKVIHKLNGGLSDARNAGIDVASGEYLTFVDSDDWIEPDFIELLYSNLVKYNADISICSFSLYSIDAIVPFYNGYREILPLTNEQALVQCFKGEKWTVSAWGKLYKKHIFEDIRYPFGKCYEDLFIVVDVFSRVKNVVVDTNPRYYYRLRKGSITGEGFNKKSMENLEAAETALKMIETKFPALIYDGKKMMLTIVVTLCYGIIVMKHYKKMSEYRLLFTVFKENFWFIIKSDMYRREEKMKLCILRLNVSVYKFLQTVNKKLNRQGAALSIFYD